jgi:multicomponent Na+:H+ antiporter subunit F
MRALEALTALFLGLAGLGAILRIVRTGSLANRALGADLLVVVVGAAAVLFAAITEETLYLGLVLIVGLVGFVGTVAAARFIEQRGST